MPGQEAPSRQLTTGSVPNIIEYNIPTVEPIFFQPATWEPLKDKGKVQYGQFVALMIERVQNNWCTWLEVRSLVFLIATEHNWDFMNLAMPHLPELNTLHPPGQKDFGMAFLHLLKPKYHQRMFDKAKTFIRDRYVNGLSPVEVNYLKHSLFGPDWGPEDCERTNRFFKSTLELGFPQPALDKLVREARERGTDIERSVYGLPTNLNMPERPQEPLVGPPGIQRTSAERAEFKAYYDGPEDDFLKYYQ